MSHQQTGATVSTPSRAVMPSLSVTAPPAPTRRYVPQLPLEGLAWAIRRQGPGAVTLRRSDDWPHTTRVLPWMLAAFMAMLWLLPYNSISMTVSLPFDLKLDRIVLPIIALVWGLSLVTGGEDAPRIRLTPVHAAIGAFLAIAFLSDALAASHLNQNLELNLAIKKLTLLVAYVSLFVMVASVLRRSEVGAFLTYTLLLGVVCAVGTLIEYRFKYNIFYDLPAKLLPSLFHVAQVNSAAVDDLGRRLTMGPTESGLEAAAMFSMALPIAIVGVTHTEGRKRVLYGLAFCVLLAATISTYKKTALIAPGVALLAFGFYRRRQLLKLVPLGVVAVLAIHVLSPGALGSVTQQFQGSKLTAVNTTNHRTVAYDAIRPDVLSHPLVGAGYGSYDQPRNRILDSAILDLLIEVGVLGLIAFVAMVVAVVGVATPTIRGRDRLRSPPALAAALAAIVFLTVSFLYDSISDPHAPYIFLTFAGFVAVLTCGVDKNPLRVQRGDGKTDVPRAVA